jgi:glutamine synthetase
MTFGFGLYMFLGDEAKPYQRHRITMISKIESGYEQQLRKFISEHDIDTVSIVGTDLHGFARGKQMTASRFLTCLENPIHLSTLFILLDYGNYPINPPANDDQWWPSWETGYSDSYAVIDPTTIRAVPWQPRTALIICEFKATNSAYSLDFLPRNLVRNLVSRYENLGYTVRMGLEIETTLFRESAMSATKKGFRNLEPLWRGLQAYLLTSLGKNHKFIGKLISALREFGICLESWHLEAGPGQLEITLAPNSPLEIVDHSFLLKHAIKELAAENELLASFMAQISTDGFSNGCHVNVSVWQGEKNLFFSNDSLEDSPALRDNFVAGILATLPDFTLLYAPTPNSFRRLKPYQWTGTQTAWGQDNKSTAVRVVNESSSSARIEQRTGGADANPYLLAAAVLAAGLYGIENELEAAPPVIGDAYAKKELASLPQDISAALALFSNSKPAETYLGKDFVRFYAHTRAAEADLCHKFTDGFGTKEVSDWELERYFEFV